MSDAVAAACKGPPLGVLLFDRRAEVLRALVRNPALTEADALVLLGRKDLPGEIIQRLAADRRFEKSYAFQLAVVRHPHTPLALSRRWARFLFPFDLVTLTQLTSVRVELKMFAEELLIGKMASLPIGARITLARRATARVAVALLKGGNRAIFDGVLNNPQMTENVLLAVLNQSEISQAVLQRVGSHPKWSLRPPIQCALVRHPQTPLALALRMMQQLGRHDLQELFTEGAIAPSLRDYWSKMHPEFFR